MTIAKEKRKNLVIVMGLVSLLCIGGIAALFTDTDTATNTFTVGNVSIDLTEPLWDDLDDTDGDDIPDVAENITPNLTITKDPMVTNDGANDAYMYLTVAVPVEAGKNTVADQLFTYTVDNSWVEIGSASYDADSSAMLHTYAYGTADANGMTSVAPEAATSKLFTSVTVADGKELGSSNLDIVINAYGIQTSDLGSANTAEAIWTVLQGELA